MCLFQGVEDHLVHIFHRVLVLGDSQVKPGGVEHGADIVGIFFQLFQFLADAGVVFVPADIAVGVHRDFDTRIGQGLFGLF